MFLIILVLGFPLPYITLLSINGHLHTVESPFTNYESKVELIDLKKVPKPTYDTHFFTFCKNAGVFSYFDADSMYFLYTDGKHAAIRYNLTLENHRTLPKTKSHKILGLFPQGIRIGQYFWILGYKKDPGDQSILFDTETLLWSIKKHKWIKGPNLTLNWSERASYFGSVGTNSSTVFIFSTNQKQFMYSFDFSSNSWKSQPPPPKALQRHDIVSTSLSIEKDFTK